MSSAGTSETLAGVVRISFPSHSLENSVSSAFSHKHEILLKSIIIYNYLGHKNELKKKILGKHFGDHQLSAIAAAAATHLPLGPVMRRAGGVAHWADDFPRQEKQEIPQSPGTANPPPTVCFRIRSEAGKAPLHRCQHRLALWLQITRLCNPCWHYFYDVN